MKPAVLTNTAGFIYYVSIAGITGTAAPDAGAVSRQVARIKASTSLPVAVGFGIRTPEQAAAIARFADAAVVGSALVSIAGAAQTADAAVNGIHRLVRELSTGVRQARRPAAE